MNYNSAGAEGFPAATSAPEASPSPDGEAESELFSYLDVDCTVTVAFLQNAGPHYSILEPAQEMRTRRVGPWGQTHTHTHNIMEQIFFLFQ